MTDSQLRARYRRIIRFFAGVTAQFIWWEIVLPKVGLNSWSNATRSRRHQRIATRFRALAIQMGGLMIKVGQFLSARLDILPAEITAELAGLQDEVPPAPFESIRTLAEAELGKPLTEVYASFDPEPLAAASLGQAHRAKLRPESAEQYGFEDVVVKVQRPDIDKIVEVDLAALRQVAQWLTRYKPVAKRADVPALVEEFAATTVDEIDYVAEARSAETFAKNFAENPRVHVPKVVWTDCTPKVLTLEDVSAIKLSDYDAIEAAGISRAEVASVLLDTYMQQILEDGFFHADPHPGNLFVTPLGTVDEDGNAEWRLTFIDFGMVGRVPDNLREGLREVLIAVGTQDAKRLVQSYQTLGILLPSADLKMIENASTQLFERFWGRSMSDLRSIDHREIADFAMQFQDLVLDLPVQIPENLLLLGRTIALLSGMCTGLDPEFNVAAGITPYATKLVDAEGGSTVKTVIDEALKILQIAIGLPARTDRVLSTIERGQLSVQTPRLDMRVRRLERSVDRVGGTLAFGALLVAGAIVFGTDPTFGKWLMAGSLLPAGWVLMTRRGGHPGR